MAAVNHGEGGFYRYGGPPRPDRAGPQTEKFRKLLKANRQRLAYNASSARPLAIRLNQQVAQALRDGMKVARLSEAAGLSRWTVRTIGLSFDDLLPSGLLTEQRLAVICRLRSELADLEESKADLEKRRAKLLADARRLGLLDDYELAALCGLQHHAIRKMARAS